MTKRDLVNPRTNRLVAGVTEADVLDAVGKSGYPLQNVVSDYLQTATFRTVEEWSYLDKESGQLRTIDVKAEKPLFEYGKGRHQSSP